MLARLGAALNGEPGTAEADAPTPAFPGPERRRALFVIAAAVILGGALRVFMARGDLWLDEAWSLSLVGGLSSAGEIVYGLPHDNNHVLNSLWMWLLGPARPAWAYRVPAVMLGTLSIALAARMFWRRSRASAVAAALLAAAALPLMVYGSEARGYAGLIAATLFAIDSFERAVQATDQPHGAAALRWQLGVAIGVGALWHLTALATLAVLALAAFMRFARARPFCAAIDATVDLFAPSLVCLVPALSALLVSVLRRGGFTLGGTVPPSGATFIHGYGDLLRSMLGLPAALPAGACLAGAGVLIVVGLRCRAVGALRRDQLLAGAIMFPAAMVLARFPNLAMPRYYLVAGLVVLLATADVLGRLWDSGAGPARALSACLLGALLTSQTIHDRAALADARGRYGDALALMADPSGSVRFGTHDPFQVEVVAAAAARRRALVTRVVPDQDFCRDAPLWFVDVPEGEPSPVLQAGISHCSHRFVRVSVVPTNPLSGMRWVLYRLVDDGARK